MYVRHGTKVRQGTNEAPTDFAELLFHALG
jgi:hypothetical protein